MRYLTALLFLLAATVASASTTFSYQGQLQDDSGPFNGHVDMSFTLIDAETGGSQVGSTIQLTDVVVIDGLFRVDLDFGEQAYGSGLWLAIRVEGDPLLPRQAITGAPFAISMTEDGPDPPSCDTPAEDCGDYCDAMQIGCSGDFSSYQECLDACACYPNDGQEGDESGDTLQCRETWLQKGFAGDVSPEVACTNAAPASPECID